MYISITEAARIGDVCRETIYRALKNNELKLYKDTNYVVKRLSLDEVKAWIENKNKPKVFVIKKIKIDSKQPCLNCDGTRYTYDRPTNKYFACPSCNSSSPFTRARV